MKNKKKKGFTLIELLAIIVILAIIAVITVPIILNIIENSKKGAATDSAYGYKDAVNKWYVQKLSEDYNFMLSDQYIISNGKVNGIEIPASGDKPSSGYLNYSNNTLTGGCLVFGDYAVTFTNGEVSNTEKGECPPAISPVVYRNTSGSISSTADDSITAATQLNVGDYVKLGNSDGFYVIKKPTSTDTNVLLLAEYNITNKAASNTPAEWKQVTSADATYERVYFSVSDYWSASFATTSDCSLDTYSYCPKYNNEGYAYVYTGQTTTVNNNTVYLNNLYEPIENYKDYLKETTGLTLTVRPMSYKEAYDLGINNDSVTAPTWSFYQDYWLGSGSNNDGSNGFVWDVINDGTMQNYGSNWGNYTRGVRPLIELPATLFNTES